MTFVQRYQLEDSWSGKVIIMSLYHTAMSQRNKRWTLIKTANEFDVSIGLVSENLTLAFLIDKHPSIINCKTRQEALEKRKRFV